MRLFLLLTLLAEIACAQSKIRLVDSQSRLGIAYANIWCDGKLLVSTDSTGTANLALKDCSKLTVSATGFKTKTIDVAHSTVFLDADTLQIRDVEVRRPTYKKSLTLGKVKSGDIGIVVRRENTVGSVGRFFASAGDYFLKEFQFKAHRSDNRLVTISVYGVDKNQKPDELLVQTIVKQLPKGNGICKVDLTQYQISMPEDGVFISVNFVLIDQNKNFSERSPEWFFYEPSLNATRTGGFENTWHLDESGWKKSENYRLDFALKLTD